MFVSFNKYNYYLLTMVITSKAMQNRPAAHFEAFVITILA